jgi:hypothetical protein
MSEWEVYFQEEIYSCDPDKNPEDALKSFLLDMQGDNACEYKMPVSIALRGHDGDEDDEWEWFEITDLGPSEPKTTFWFDVTFQVPESDLEDGQPGFDFLDRFYEAGCDDGLVSFGGKERKFNISFARESGNIAAAIFSALCDIQKVVPDMKLLSIVPFDEPPPLPA